MVKIMQEYPG